MGFDLIGRHGDMSFSFDFWCRCFDIAVAFGWRPAGTVAPADCRGEWRGTYLSSDLQEVADDDARAFGAALHRAATALRSAQNLTEEQVNACNGANVDAICRSCRLRRKGRVHDSLNGEFWRRGCYELPGWYF